jgi:2-dehydro-3-deoxygluconokinase
LAEGAARSPDDRSGAPDVVTLGECLVALIATNQGPLAEAGAFERHVAGAEANVAVGLARLGHRPAYIGRVGADGFGTAVLRRLRGEGVLTEFLTVDEAAPTGLLVRERRTLGPAEVVYYRAGSAGSRLDPADVDASIAAGLFAGARWLHLTGITPALSTTARAAVDTSIAAARSAGLTISLDLNLRRKLWSEHDAASTLRRLTAEVDIVLGSRAEAALVVEADATTDPKDLAQALVRIGPSTAVIKLGAAGALAMEPSRSALMRPALATPVVDTIGAGDGFTAGFIAARLEGETLERALEMANACGASAVSVVGDLTGLPERHELDRLLAPSGGDDALR